MLIKELIALLGDLPENGEIGIDLQRNNECGYVQSLETQVIDYGTSSNNHGSYGLTVETPLIGEELAIIETSEETESVTDHYVMRRLTLDIAYPIFCESEKDMSAIDMVEINDGYLLGWVEEDLKVVSADVQ